jgi:hypothetical protein
MYYVLYYIVWLGILFVYRISMGIYQGCHRNWIQRHYHFEFSQYQWQKWLICILHADPLSVAQFM